MQIKDIMSKDLVVMDLNSSINDICEAMRKYDIGFMPINDDKKIVGVITDRDIVVRSCFGNDYKAKDYITKDVIFIDGNKNINKALDLMGKEKVKRLIVTNEDKVIGIISFSDLIKKADKDRLIRTLENIFSIDKNKHIMHTQIDEFYL